MNPISFDTDEGVGSFCGAVNEGVATKNDLLALGKELQSEVIMLGRELRAETRESEQGKKARLESLEHRLLIFFGVIMVAGLSFLFMLERLFPVSGP